MEYKRTAHSQYFLTKFLSNLYPPLNVGGTTKHHAPADLHHPSSRVTDLDDLGVEQVLGGDEPGMRFPPDLPPPPATIDDAQYLEQRRAIGFPAVGEQEGYLPHMGDDLGHQRGSVLLRARAYVNPEDEPTAHRERCMNPYHLAGTEFGMASSNCTPGTSTSRTTWRWWVSAR